ncbi:LysR substrate-binding domain-containing protein [Methylovirgula sp. 4M-Z18]|uniref:LysR substrate-binding domain-containing protein n=1 Tax=Methylovirgula sp. 4M-Z18 TaxID=2293567 RepID=UPI000E2FCBC1|nr:LysR substrate-binding domain-containing protein [Methylovirgula sp. 4M-Z18]RFB78704.1 LysR family transcriptional regulator [Methylovirgula sp. 4M-Z18]
MSRPLPPLRLLQVFETVLRTGGAREAARELNVSQPAVSQSLRALEEHLGVRLLDRATRPARLTEAGRILRQATLDGLGRITEGLDDIARLGGIADNAVTVACSVGFATYWLMPRLKGFYAEHPDITVNVLTSHQGAPPLAPGVDLALRYGPGTWTDGEVTLLFEERVTPVCTPTYAAHLPQDDGGLDAATLIHVDFEDPRWLTWADYLRAAGPRGTRPRPGLHFNNYVQATQAALNDQGVMLGWRSITGDLTREQRLVALPLPPLEPEDGYYCVAWRQSKPRAAREALRAWLIASAGMGDF